MHHLLTYGLYGNLWLKQLYSTQRCEIEIEVPMPGQEEPMPVRISQGGDMAAAHAGFAMDSPVNRKGCCFRCCLEKCDWFNVHKVKTARRRNFVYQSVANHVNPFKRMPGLENTAPPKCPHCEVTLTDAFCADEAARWKEMSANQKTVKRREHQAAHAGGQFLQQPLHVLDHRRRARSALHRRMNACANNIAVTFMSRPFNLKQRLRANLLLKRRSFLWKFPEQEKKRASTPTGNDARRFHTDAQALVGLIKIFYDTDDNDETILPGLRAAADAAAQVFDVEDDQAHLPGLETIHEEEETYDFVAAAANVKKTRRRAAPKGKAKGKAAPKTQGKKKKKRVVEDVVVGDGSAVTTQSLASYRKKRTAVEMNPLADNAAHDEALDREDVEGEADVEADESLLPGEEADLMEDTLEEDVRTGNVYTAVEVWRTSILHQADVHATIEDHFDMAQRRAYGEKGQASGRVWAIAVQEHSNFRACWQYIHDSFAHFLEDAMEHGAAERVDDSILEKGNRRKKKLGLRCCFHAGTNKDGATYKQRRKVPVYKDGKKTGEFVTKISYREANWGVTAQMQWLDMVGQTITAGKPSKEEKMTKKQRLTNDDQQLDREMSRGATLEVITKLAEAKKMQCALEVSLST
jgi:hypothetical protein